eukprot:6843-Heterococcus_DN1.PRE.4
MSSGAAVSSGAGSSRVMQGQPYKHCVTGVTVTNYSIIDEVHVAANWRCLQNTTEHCCSAVWCACVLCSSAAWCMLYVQTSFNISTAQLLTVSSAIAN